MAPLIPRDFPWRSRLLWLRIGYGLTAAWMIAILVITRQDVNDPLFDLLFSVPLGGWILGMIVARIVGHFWPAPQTDADRKRTRL
jgi:hypothetical protein